MSHRSSSVVATLAGCAVLAGCSSTYNTTLVMLPHMVATVEAEGGAYIEVENLGPGEVAVSNQAGELEPLGRAATRYTMQEGVPTVIRSGEERTFVEIEVRSARGVELSGPYPAEDPPLRGGGR